MAGLQIGAAFVSTEADAVPAVTRVPAGLSCYQPASRLSTAHRDAFSGIAAAPLVLPNNSVSCSFGLAAAATGSVFNLEDLQLKLRRDGASNTAAASGSAAAEASQARSLLYAVEWNAHAPVQALPTTPAAMAAPQDWSLTVTVAGLASQQTWRRLRSNGARPIMQQMCALQQALLSANSRSAAAVAMAVRGLPEGSTVSPSGAATSSAPAAVALMRVAAQEAPAVAWVTHALDAAAPRPVQPLPEADSFAVAASGGIWLTPRLRSHADPAAANTTRDSTAEVSQCGSLTGTVLVSGGLGDIGLLAAQWLAALAPAARLVLLSRSGRSSRVAKLAAAMRSAGGTQITVCRCDVISRGEILALVAKLDSAGDVQPAVDTPAKFSTFV